MLDKYWKQFKSGTDIRGVACEGVPGQEVNLTDEVIERMAAGFALWLAAKTGRPAGISPWRWGMIPAFQPTGSPQLCAARSCAPGSRYMTAVWPPRRRCS